MCSPLGSEKNGSEECVRCRSGGADSTTGGSSMRLDRYSSEIDLCNHS